MDKGIKYCKITTNPKAEENQLGPYTKYLGWGGGFVARVTMEDETGKS